MIDNKTIQGLLLTDDTVVVAEVEGDGYHYQLTIVSDSFKGKRPVARQQWVYAKLQPYITSGELHAITMQTWTTEEWGKQRA